MKIFANIPIFVWPLLALLLWSGLKARKPNQVPLRILILLPVVFFTWSGVSFIGRYASDPWILALWGLFIGMGFWLGLVNIQRLSLSFDRERKMVNMPGSWIPLILSMSIFGSKFTAGMMRGMFPELSHSWTLIGLELFAGLILGVFAGRSVGCLLKYRASTRSIG